MPKNTDLNMASTQDLEQIQGIGKDYARKIVEHRTQSGSFKSWDDLRRVPGVTNEMLDTLKRSGFTVSGKAA
jgi:competence protein ComEA